MKLCYFLIISTFFIAWAPCVNAKSKKHPCEYKRNKLCRKILTLKKNINKDYALELSNIFYKASRKYKVPQDILLAIAYQESTFVLDSVRSVKGLVFQEGEYKEISVGSDFCMMQINSRNISKMNLKVQKLISDPAYCIDNGAIILKRYHRLHAKADEKWWTYYNAISGFKREKYYSDVFRHIQKIAPEPSRSVARVISEPVKENESILKVSSPINSEINTEVRIELN
jgi:hypothetical protein